MGFEDLATKTDLKDLEQRLIKNIHKEQEKERIPRVVTTENACLLFDGVSDKFLHSLRKDGKLNPVKIGGLWFWNFQEIKNILPKDPE